MLKASYILRGLESTPNVMKLLENKLFVGCYNGTVIIFDALRRRKLQVVVSPNNAVLMTIQFDSSHHLYTQARDGYIRMYSMENTITEMAAIDTGSMSFCKSDIQSIDSVSSTSLISACPSSDANIVNVWNLDDQEIIATMDPNTDDLNLGMCMAVKLIENEGQPYCISCYENGGLYLWDCRQQKILIDSGLISNEPLLAMDLISVPRSCFEILSAGAGEYIYNMMLNIGEGSIQLLKKVKIANSGVNDLKIRNDCKIFATAGWDKRARVYSMKSKKQKALLKYHTENISCLEFSNADNTIYCGSKDNKISAWRVY
eukprot:TRINITY_DN8241_c0_g1_i2.p1 TRINITY_DN8241_c0_g1~~TRINITY_DN8241_c0_g1_i2.p1  ORF type:complete len:316 (+),score=54.65 TRINITY_DN8241_c0_g1_i2:3-950(+)